jgi:hypothetical protein
MSRLQQLPLEMYSKIASYLNERDVQNLIWATNRLPLRRNDIARPAVFMTNEIDYSRLHLYTIAKIQFEIAVTQKNTKYFIRNTCSDVKCMKMRSICYDDRHKGKWIEMQNKSANSARCIRKMCKCCYINNINYEYCFRFRKTHSKRCCNYKKNYTKMIKFNIIKFIQNDKRFYNKDKLSTVIAKYLQTIKVSNCKNEYLYLLNDADWMNFGSVAHFVHLSCLE